MTTVKLTNLYDFDFTSGSSFYSVVILSKISTITLVLRNTNYQFLT